MHEKMNKALARLSGMIRAAFPDDLKIALLAYGQELDRLRAELSELRSIIEEKGKK